MTTIEDGPAAGKCLMLKRCPVLLRVVIDTKTGGIDALNETEDIATANESIHVYKAMARPTWCHIYMRGGRGGFYEVASYKLYSTQPPDEVLRDNDRWAEWATAEWPKIKHEFEPAP